MDEQDLYYQSQPGYKLKTITLEALATGETIIDMKLYWGAKVLRQVQIHVYVNE